MIADRCFGRERMRLFIYEVDNLFIPSISVVIEQKGMCLREYADKLADKATVAYESSKNGNVKALIAGYMHDTPDKCSHITLVAVKKKYQRKGLFKKLFAEYEKYAKAAGFNSIWLEVLPNNTTALSAYKAVGFKEASEQQIGICAKYKLEKLI